LVRRKTIGFAWILACAAVFILASETTAGKAWKHSARRGGTIQWTYDLDTGIARAKKQDKPVMIDFMAVWCPPCKAMEDSTFSDADVIRKAGAFIPVRIDIDKQRDLAARYNGLARKYGGIGIPNILFMKADGTKLKHIVGYYTPEQLIAAMDSALAAPE
jgi:thiol:disulfide interchange protein